MEQILVRHGPAGERPDAEPAPQLFGALDLGTNNCRLLMATPQGDGFRVVDAFSRPTRLGQGVAASGRLCDEAIERTLSVLRLCAERLVRHNATHVRSVATEACRRAANCRAFLRRAEAETGLSIEIISVEEEARLALAGCAPLLDRSLPHALVFDIGGGSTELIRVRLAQDPAGDEMTTFASLPLGVVGLSEHYQGELGEPGGYEAAVQEVVRLLQPLAGQADCQELIRGGRLQMLGTSGTVTTLAGIHLDLPRYDRAMVDGYRLDFADIRTVSRRLLAASPAERAAHPCVGARAGLVLAGCAILEAICRCWPLDRLTVADRGVREGLLLTMMRAARREETP